MLEERQLLDFEERRYAGWSHELGSNILSGKADLENLHHRVLNEPVSISPVSGAQERLENLVNRYV